MSKRKVNWLIVLSVLVALPSAIDSTDNLLNKKKVIKVYGGKATSSLIARVRRSLWK